MSTDRYDTDFSLRALEAQRYYAERHGLRTADLKPCVAVLLDGNLGGAARHDAAFCIAIELRRMGCSYEHARRVIRQWASGLGYSSTNAERCVRSAFAKSSEGEYRYRPPGLHKNSLRYRTTLLPICQAVGCPSKCTPLSMVHRAAGTGGFEEFSRVGWPSCLRRNRQRSTVDIYRALCWLERRRAFPPGAPMFTSYRQLAPIADVNEGTVGRGLRTLTSFRLIEFEPGSGSGPNARDRKGSRVQRVLPIPVPPSRPLVFPQ
jgi:hypothetical protein